MGFGIQNVLGGPGSFGHHPGAAPGSMTKCLIENFEGIRSYYLLLNENYFVTLELRILSLILVDLHFVHFELSLANIDLIVTSEIFFALATFQKRSKQAAIFFFEKRMEMEF